MATIRVLNREAYRLAIREYRRTHGGRLPGSERTARLRKKRRDAVMRHWLGGKDVRGR